MAEGLFCRVAGEPCEAFSEGTRPVDLHANAVKAMKGVRIDISKHRSKSVDEFVGQPFDCIISLSADAKESCPVFPRTAKRLHHSFQDPAALPADKQFAAFREVRDEMASLLKNPLPRLIKLP